MLTTKTKMDVYKACVLSTLLYGSEAWTMYTRQERKLKTFHMRCLRKIQGIAWQDRIPDKDVLARAGMPSMFALLSQRRLRWLGHVRRMKNGIIPKDTLYGELATGTRPTRRHVLRFRGVSGHASARVRGGDGSSGMRKRNTRNRWQKQPGAKTFKCSNCNRVCASSIGLYSQQTLQQPGLTYWRTTHCLSR